MTDERPVPRGSKAPYPSPSSPAVSRVMKGNRRTGTKPERRLRSAFHGVGLRFRVDFPIRAGTVLVRPDIVFTKHRVAVFVDGCFWHGCPEHGTSPAANAGYWTSKLLRNRQRDARVDAALTEAGWMVLRLWEHTPTEDALAAVEDVLGRGHQI